MVPAKFLVFFAWYHIVYTSLVLLLLLQYTWHDGGMWFLLLQSMYTAGALAIRQLFPGFIKRTAHLNVFKAVKPLVYALEGVHVFVLGILWTTYHSRGATYSLFFPVMMFFKCLELIAFGMVSGHKNT